MILRLLVLRLTRLRPILRLRLRLRLGLWSLSLGLRVWILPSGEDHLAGFGSSLNGLLRLRLRLRLGLRLGLGLGLWLGLGLRLRLRLRLGRHTRLFLAAALAELGIVFQLGSAI